MNSGRVNTFLNESEELILPTFKDKKKRSVVKQSLLPPTDIPLKKQDRMQMLPSTPKYHKGTKRELFARRMSMMDRPIIVFTFQGLLGDFIKSFAKVS
jgi:hypothetical protein